MTDPTPMNPLSFAVQRAIADLDRVDWTEADTRKALERPSSFALFSGEEHADEMFKTWALGPVIEHRDSGILQRSNARVLRREIERAEKDGIIESDSYNEISCNHWAVGHVDHMTFRVLDDAGQVTRVARWLKAWFDGLSDYPVADESDHSELELEETYANIRLAGEMLVRRMDPEPELPEEWVDETWRWFWDNDQSAVENCDDQGGHPTDDQLRAAWTALGWLKEAPEGEEAGA